MNETVETKKDYFKIVALGDELRNKGIVSKSYGGILALLQGLGLTLRHFFRRKITILYPEQRRTIANRYRGRFAYLFNSETKKTICIGCGNCTKVCPPGAITLKTSKGEDKKIKVDEYTVDIGLCIGCGNCADVCAVNAIEFLGEYELAETDRKALIYDMNKLAKYIVVKEKVKKVEKAEG